MTQLSEAWLLPETKTRKITMVGPKRWRNASVKNLKIAQTAVKESTKKNCIARQSDPLPNYRDSCVELTNNTSLSYMRQTRSVVLKLRQVMLQVNEEIKALLKEKEKLIKILENVRKDKLLNKQVKIIRSTRPKREKEVDGADCLISSERLMLDRLKYILEREYRETNKHLQYLNAARKLLNETIQERRLVLDLIPDAAASVLPHSGILCPLPKNDAEKLYLGVSRLPDSPIPHPFSAFTPEADKAINLGLVSVEDSQTFRKKIMSRIEMSELDIEEARDKVNSGISRKVAETGLLARHLHLTCGRNRCGIHRSSRHISMTEIAKGYTLGPMSYQDIRTSERLDRPMVNCFQRHVGKQVPEAESLIFATEGLNESLQKSRQDLTLLRLTKMHLRDDLVDKELAMHIDSDIVRLKKRRSDYRWVMEGKNLTV